MRSIVSSTMRTHLLLVVIFAIVHGTVPFPTDPPDEEQLVTPDAGPGQKNVRVDQGPADERNVNEDAFQGDMMLTDDQRAEIEEAIDDLAADRKKRKATIYDSYRWPEKVVPYVITNTSEPDSDVILSAISYWQNNTCLSFEPLTESHSSQLGHETYLSFFQGGGCWSYVGWALSEEQPVSIGSGCAYLGIVAHEIGHAIGFHHEQSRPDRDDFVTIHPENIREGVESNFDKYTWDEVTSEEVPYDVGSVMHYSTHAFSSNGHATITTTNPLNMNRLGNRDGISFADFKLANLIYGCNEECTSSPDCENGGYQGPDCGCVCRPGFVGDLCENEGGSAEGPPVCARKFTDTEGELESPNYPNNYDDDLDCLYLIEGPPGTVVQLTFEDFAVEDDVSCRWDAVEIYGADISVTPEKFCGTETPPVQTSSDNQLLVGFKSDASWNYKGFSATYSIIASSTTVAPTTEAGRIEGSCGGFFNETRGAIASPKYPRRYRNGLDCEYVIEAAPDMRVELTIIHLDVQNHAKCKKDSLAVSISPDIKLPMIMCGQTLPRGSIVSMGSRMVLKFKTNPSRTATGFAARYRVIDV